MIRAILALAIFVVSALAQNAELSGVVRDPSDAVIPNASVTARNDDTAAVRAASTSAEGIYTLSLLPPGRYTVEIRAPGFYTVTHRGIRLSVGQAARLDVTLQPGALEQSVTVSAEAALLKTDSATISTIVNRQFIENLPLNGRSFQSLIALTPGVVLTKATFGEQGQFSVNGQRANANYFTIDGASANIGVSAGLTLVQSASGSLPGLGATGGTNTLVSVEALEEFRVQTSGYAPEYGRMPGAQVTILTRSGTNDFHGALFNFFRNDGLDANDWFASAYSLPKPALRQNDFGGVLGGPVRLPRLYHGRDRTFFFFSYEGLRLRQPQVLATDVPSLAVRNQAGRSVRPFLEAFPLPNRPEGRLGFATFVSSFSDASSLDATSLRLDHLFGTRVSVFGRYNHAPSNYTARLFALNNPTDTIANTGTLTAGATVLMTPRLVAEMRFNWSHTTGGELQPARRFRRRKADRPKAVLPVVRGSTGRVWRVLFARGREFELVPGQERRERANAVQHHGRDLVHAALAPVEARRGLPAHRDAEQPARVRSVLLFRRHGGRAVRPHQPDHDRRPGDDHGLFRQSVALRAGHLEGDAARDVDVWGALGGEPGAERLEAALHVRGL